MGIYDIHHVCTRGRPTGGQAMRRSLNFGAHAHLAPPRKVVRKRRRTTFLRYTPRFRHSGLSLPRQALPAAWAYTKCTRIATLKFIYIYVDKPTWTRQSRLYRARTKKQSCVAVCVHLSWSDKSHGVTLPTSQHVCSYHASKFVNDANLCMFLSFMGYSA